MIVLVAAVLPLTVIGLWVTRSIASAGESLLRSELEESSGRVAAGVEERWRYRRADLGLLSSNVAAQRLVGQEQQGTIAEEDSVYLERLFAGLVASVQQVRYTDRNGRVVRTLVQAASRDSIGANRALAVPNVAPLITVRLPILSADEDTLGQMMAGVILRAVLPSDTALRLPNNATVQVINRDNGSGLLPSTMADSLFRNERFEDMGEVWLAARRSIADPPIDLVVAGPRGRYVTPFQAAARTGVLALGLVSLGAVLLTAYLARRVTASLESLADAATAVAAGQLDRRVDANGTEEVQRVATAFNSMTESLRRTLGALSQRQALAAVGEYAASMAHEVRNALTAIRVDLQHATEKPGENAESQLLITRALTSVRRLDATVTSSLRVARGGRTPRSAVDIRDVLASAARGAESAFAERGARLDAPPAGTPLRVRGDRLALEQMVLNLLLNAAQALPSGGQAKVTVETDEQSVRIAIVDTGVGIARDDLVKVLDPFYSTRNDGTGLGLPIARQIASAHDGSLQVTSTIGEGTSVEIRLPLIR